MKLQRRRSFVRHILELTYRDKGPVTEVVNGAEEPELVQEKVGSCHGALIWKGRANPVMNQSINQ